MKIAENLAMNGQKMACNKLSEDDNEKREAAHKAHRYVDTHCHLPKMFHKLNFEGSFGDFKKQYAMFFPKAFDGCINIFDNPQYFGSRNAYENLLNEEQVYNAFGCHPCNAHYYNLRNESLLKQNLQRENVVALGEIGLDYFRDCADRAIQKAVFRDQLKIAVDRQMPIVIHSRDAEEDTLKIVKQYVPHNHLIHRHCYPGNWEQLEEWLSYFPNLYVGFTNLVTYPSMRHLHDVVSRIPLERILLETDAPHHFPHNVPMTEGYECSNPGMAIFVASKIASCRPKDTFEDVLQATRKNTTAIYGI